MESVRILNLKHNQSVDDEELLLEAFGGGDKADCF